MDAFSKTNSGSSEIIKASGFVVEKTIHYHMAVKLTRARRWASIRNYLQREYGICVNFSNVHTNYFSAWRNVIKEDNSYIESMGIQNLQMTLNLVQRMQLSKIFRIIYFSTFHTYIIKQCGPKAKFSHG